MVLLVFQCLLPFSALNSNPKSHKMAPRHQENMRHQEEVQKQLELLMELEEMEELATPPKQKVLNMCLAVMMCCCTCIWELSRAIYEEVEEEPLVAQPRSGRTKPLEHSQVFVLYFCSDEHVFVLLASIQKSCMKIKWSSRVRSLLYGLELYHKLKRCSQREAEKKDATKGIKLLDYVSCLSLLLCWQYRGLRPLWRHLQICWKGSVAACAVWNNMESLN